MFSSRSFDKNIYIKIIRWAYIFLMLNLAFTLTNLPLFLAILFLAIDVRNFLIFCLASLFLGPSLISLIAVFDQWREDKDVEPFRTYFMKLKSFGLAGFKYWSMVIVLSVIVMADVWFSLQVSWGRWLIFPAIAFLILAVVFFLYLAYFRVRNPEHGFLDIARAAAFFVLDKWYLSLISLVVFATMLGILVLKPQFGFLLSTSLLTGLLFLNCRMLFAEKN